MPDFNEFVITMSGDPRTRSEHAVREMIYLLGRHQESINSPAIQSVQITLKFRPGTNTVLKTLISPLFEQELAKVAET